MRLNNSNGLFGSEGKDSLDGKCSYCHMDYHILKRVIKLNIDEEELNSVIKKREIE